MKRVGKWILYIAGGLAGLVLLAGAIGLFLPSRVAGSASVEIARAPEAVWALVSDPEKLGAWAGGEIMQVEFLQRAAPRRYRYTGSMGWATYEETVADAPRRIKTRVVESSMGMGGEWDIRIEAEGAGSRVSVDMAMEFSNPWFRVLGAIMNVSGEEKKTLLKLKSYLEARS